VFQHVSVHQPSRSRSADYGASDPAGKGQFQTSGGAGSFADDLCKERGIVIEGENPVFDSVHATM